MEGLIDLEIASELDKKYFLAFLKGLTQIKFKSQMKKSGQSQENAEEPEVDLEYLYQNLFNDSSISGD